MLTGPEPLHGLNELTTFLLAEEDLNACLDGLAHHAAEATAAGSCSIMLISDPGTDGPRLKLWASTQALPAGAWTETHGMAESIVGHVLQERQALLIKDIEGSVYARMARRRDNMGSSFMCVPISVAGGMIGVMNLANQPGDAAFGESQLVVAKVVAALIGKSVQVERLQTLLRSRVAQISLSREGKQAAVRLTDGVMAPGEIARMLAKSFYKDLAGAGFAPAQIVSAASEIVAQITGDIGRHKTRLARHKRPQTDSQRTGFGLTEVKVRPSAELNAETWQFVENRSVRAEPVEALFATS